MSWVKNIINNRKKLFNFFRYIIMAISLCYVLYGYIFLPTLNKCLPSLMQFCPQNIVDYINSFLIANTATIGFNNSKALFVALFIFVYTLLFGRAFCSFFCPMGTIQEVFGKLGKHLRCKVLHIDDKLAIPAKFDRPLRYIKYVVLGCTIFFAWFWGLYIVNIKIFNIPILQLFNPWIAIEYIKKPMIMFSLVLIAFISLIIICALCLVYERFYCKYLCPAGAMYGLISKISLIKLNKENGICSSEKCTQCNMCQNNQESSPNDDNKCKICTVTNANCQMDIDLNNTNRVKSGECIMCGDCYNDQSDNTKFSLSIIKFKIRPLLYLLLATIVFIGGMISLRVLNIEKTEYHTEFMLSDYVDYQNQHLKETGYTTITVKDYLATYNLIGVVPEDASMYDFLSALRNIPFDDFVKIKFENQMTAKKLAKIYKIPSDVDLSQSWETVMKSANATAVVSSEYGDLYMIEGGYSLEKVLTELYPNSNLSPSTDLLYGDLLPIIDQTIYESYSGNKVYKEKYKPCCVNTSSKRTKKE